MGRETMGIAWRAWVVGYVLSWPSAAQGAPNILQGTNLLAQMCPRGHGEGQGMAQEHEFALVWMLEHQEAMVPGVLPYHHDVTP